MRWICGLGVITYQLLLPISPSMRSYNDMKLLGIWDRKIAKGIEMEFEMAAKISDDEISKRQGQYGVRVVTFVMFVEQILAATLLFIIDTLVFFLSLFDLFDEG